MRPAVVLVHGIRISATQWAPQREVLRRAGIPHRAPDLPGHGRRRGEPFTIAAARQAIEDAVSALRAEHPGAPIAVVGMSMGGYLTLNWAAWTEYPPAAVLAAGCGTQPQGSGLELYRRVARVLSRRRSGGEAVSNAMARVFLPRSGQEALLQGGVAVEVMEPALEQMGTVDTHADVASIDVPIWFVNGRWDHFRIHERRFLLAAHDGHLVIVPGAHHLVSLVRPVAFSRIMLRFLDEVERQDASGGRGS
ncbi:alpha/beta fold hydrolase [Bogoriella caseilytica]|uniref:Alpha-beta hydrolase superfamily lysophospholipase n=1 Tax=Bogoriella caseilytica TaxID=56055 RepID=A0A3N2BE71_9MICO|nr:alpha/beta hydrolase [Bogoriella caseilytica]ROR73557.1 alpha-beta hydrolase superfamily lysophospholipase [Bogoriella caseilytica]